MYRKKESKESEIMTQKLIPLLQQPSKAELPPQPPLPFLKSGRMTKCRRKAWWQKTREPYQCMNLITTQMAPHNEEKVDVRETCIIHFAFLISTCPRRPKPLLCVLPAHCATFLWSMINNFFLTQKHLHSGESSGALCMPACQGRTCTTWEYRWLKSAPLALSS